MSLESGTYINSLVGTNPVGAADPKSQGDDHIRLVKTTILNTFPAITGAVTPTHTAINQTCVGTGGTFPAINGSALTALNASALASGTVADGRLSANVPLLSLSNTFLGAQIVSTAGADSAIYLIDSSAAADAKRWRMYVNAGVIQFQTRTDANVLGAAPISMSRTGTVVDSIALLATAITVNGVNVSDFARLSQDNNFSHSTAGINLTQFINTDTGTVGNVRVAVSNSTRSTYLFRTSTGYSGAFLTGGPSGEQSGINAFGAFPFSLAINDTAAFVIDGSRNFDFKTGTVTTSNASASEVGYKGLPQNSQAVSYTTVLADSNKNLHQTGATKTFTIDDTVAYPVGTALNFTTDNATGVTITCTTVGNLHLAGTATTGARTLAQYGIATALKAAANEWIISGAGLS